MKRGLRNERFVMPDPEVEFTAMYQATYPDVLRFVRRRVGEDVAADIVADVFTVAWRRWSSAPAEIRPWLFAIAHRVMSQDRRTRGRRAALQLRASADLTTQRPSVQADAVDTSLDLRRAWARLGAKDREAIALVAWDGLTGREAAHVLGCTRTTFSVRLSRARRRLRAALDDEPSLDPPSEPLPGTPSRPSPAPPMTVLAPEGEPR